MTRLDMIETFFLKLFLIRLTALLSYTSFSYAFLSLMNSSSEVSQDHLFEKRQRFMGTRPPESHRQDNQNKFHKSMKQTNNCNNNGIIKDQLNMQKLKPYLWARKMNRVQEFQDKASLDMDDGAQEKKTLERFYWLKGVAKACWWLWTSGSTYVMLCVVLYEYNIRISSLTLASTEKSWQKPYHVAQLLYPLLAWPRQRTWNFLAVWVLWLWTGKILLLGTAISC